MGRNERKEFCEMHIDVIYPKIKIILKPMQENVALYEEGIYLYSVVPKDQHLIPILQEWNGTIKLDFAVQMFRELCELTKKEYIVTEKDIKYSELFKT